MTNQTRNILRIVSLVIVVLMILMHIDIIPDVQYYRFWLMVVAYGLLLSTVKLK